MMSLSSRIFTRSFVRYWFFIPSSSSAIYLRREKNQYRLSADLRFLPDVWARGRVGPCSTALRLGTAAGSCVTMGMMRPRGIALAGRGAPGMLPKPMGPAARARRDIACTRCRAPSAFARISLAKAGVGLGPSRKSLMGSSSLGAMGSRAG